MKKRIYFLLAILVMGLVACNNTSEDDQVEEPQRPYETDYLQAHRENADDYSDLYAQDLYLDNKLIEDLYDHIIQTSNYEEKLISYDVRDYIYGDFENTYEIISHMKEDNIDSNIYDTASGNRVIETVIRQDRIFQRMDETGIKDETSFYVDTYDPSYFYVLGLDPNLNRNFTRMIYFLEDAGVEKIVRQTGKSEYKIQVADLESFRTYLELDVADDFIKHFSSLDLGQILGVDIIYEAEQATSSLSMVVYLEGEEHRLTKKVTKDQDLHFRNMENMNPEQIDLKADTNLDI